VGQATDQARHQVELTRVALAADIDKLERRIRAELDWKARLRREGPQIAAIAGVVVLVAVGGFALRRALGSGGGGKAGSDGRKGEAGGAMSLDELTREVRALREELKGGDSQPLWMKVATRAATAGAAAGASMLARRYAARAQDAPVTEQVQ
jgi:hypothetical protein